MIPTGNVQVNCEMIVCDSKANGSISNAYAKSGAMLPMHNAVPSNQRGRASLSGNTKA
ncbi:MAG TPA: hypothetical protein VJR89_25455 [Polyangiales bacterium]|nr:hypothetical protein [Polyangiales bacterium]